MWSRNEFLFRKGFQNVYRSHQNIKPEFSNSFGLKSVFEKLRFRDGLVWTVGLTVEIKLRFRDGLVWTVGLTVEIKLRFRDGLVWTVGLTVEVKLRFRDGLVWTVGLTVEIKLRFQISPVTETPIFFHRLLPLMTLFIDYLQKNSEINVTVTFSSYMQPNLSIYSSVHHLRSFCRAKSR